MDADSSVAERADNVIQLSWENTEGRVVVNVNHDRFALSMKGAVAACQAYDAVKQFTDQFRSLLQSSLAMWMAEHERKIHRASVIASSSGLLFIIVRNAVEFDPALTASLADLDIQIATDENYNLIRLETLALPLCSDVEFASFMVSGSETWTYIHADKRKSS